LLVNIDHKNGFVGVKFFFPNGWTVALIRDKPSLHMVTCMAYPSYIDRLEDKSDKELSQHLIQHGPEDVDDGIAMQYVADIFLRPPYERPT
jgi:hypothetical protein